MDKAAQLATPVLFGPGDPLLAVGLLHPDLAVYRANQRIGAVLVQALEQQFGDQLQPAERHEVARQLIQEMFLSDKISQPDPAAAEANATEQLRIDPSHVYREAAGQGGVHQRRNRRVHGRNFLGDVRRGRGV